MATEDDPKPIHTLSPSVEDKDIYKAILDTRNFEISLFWQRSNYFLVLNSALAVGFFSQKPSQLTFLLTALGFLSSMLWYFVMLGSKYWQSRWEDKLVEVEKAIAPALKAFAADRGETDAAVRRSLGASPHGGLQLWLDSQVIRKPSVSFQMTFLSMVFMLGWVLLSLWALSQGAWQASASATVQPPATVTSPAPTACPASSPAAAPSQVVNANPTISVQVNVPEQRHVPPPPKPPKPPKPKASEASQSCK